MDDREFMFLQAQFNAHKRFLTSMGKGCPCKTLLCPITRRFRNALLRRMLSR